MMNLIIGILSEKLGEVLDNRERNNYAQLCVLLLEIEGFMAPLTEETDEPFFLVYAEYNEKHVEWKGRVNATTDPIQRKLDIIAKAIDEKAE